MAEKEQSPKLFTVEEANQLLPRVRTILQHLRGYQDAVEKLERKKAVEELCWLREDGTVSPKARHDVEFLQKSIHEIIGDFEKTLEELNGLGAQLKDIDQGLVDFFGFHHGTVVCLCWKEGEDCIRYWHDLESGFSGRRPLP